MRRAIAGMMLAVAIVLGGALVVVVGLASGASAQTLTTLHSFGQGSDGRSPVAGLIFDASGNLYGTTLGGGANEKGTVFKLSPSGSETVLYSFTGGSDGGAPYAGLIFDSSGNLYGTTSDGGNPADCDSSGCGTVFKLTPSGSETVLHSFTGGSDGGDPYAGLIFDASGNVYGTTESGFSSGTVFKVTPSGSETVLHKFAGGSDGGNPGAGLIADASGNLYGTTGDGGADGYGTVFKVTPSGSEIVLYSFTAGSAISGPSSGVILDASGNLYGTTGGFPDCSGSCGTVFKVTPSGSETVLYSFTSGSDGRYPEAGLIADAPGNLYGTTVYGGANGYGTVFKVTPSGSETVLYSFTGGSDGANPIAGLIADAGGNLYGTTINGGANDGGTVFELSGAGVPLSENPQTSDFNADGKSDILLQNANGQAAIWLMNGLKVTSSGSPGTPEAGWHVIGSGDFYGSLYSDILLQNTSGELWIWEMNGTKVIGGGSPGNPGSSWHAIATGDFNGDGYADILLQNTSGEVEIWEMNGIKMIGSGSPGTPEAGWHVIGSGDFNGDGYSDILLQNISGELWIWEMNGTKVIGSGSPGDPGPSWHAIGSGDFNGDGYSDILLQNTSGAVEIWEMNGIKMIGGGSPGTPEAGWHVIGSGDFNGDGYSDILLQNTSGELWIWEMNGTKVIGSGSPGNPGPAWQGIGE